MQAKRTFGQSGFTMVELLIVVIILGVLAAIAIPQFSVNTEDAKVAALDTSLAELRNAVEMYYHQHSNVYPGAVNADDGTTATTTATAPAAFIDQLLKYSDATGKTSDTQSVDYPYGPYLKKGLPKNPFNSLADIACDVASSDITAATGTGTTGWYFYVKTGRLLANDGAHDTN